MIYAVNKTAKFKYHVLQTYEAGIALTGSEVKAVRQSQLSLKEAFVTITTHPRTGRVQAYLTNCHISPYAKAGPNPDYHPTQRRRLLLHRRELASLAGHTQQAGLTVVPLSVYTRGTQIKVELAIARGKKQFDKRETIRRRDLARDVARTLRRRS